MLSLGLWKDRGIDRSTLLNSLTSELERGRPGPDQRSIRSTHVKDELKRLEITETLDASVQDDLFAIPSGTSWTSHPFGEWKGQLLEIADRIQGEEEKERITGIINGLFFGPDYGVLSFEGF